MNFLTKINLVLAVIAGVLLLNLSIPFDSIAGKVVHTLDDSEPACSFNDQGISLDLSLNDCCSEIEKQFACKREDNNQLRCYISESSGRYYLVNRQAFKICEEEGYYAKIQK